MDLVVPQQATIGDYRRKGLLIDVTCAEPQVEIHLQCGSVTKDGIAAAISEAGKRTHLRAYFQKFNICY